MRKKAVSLLLFFLFTTSAACAPRSVSSSAAPTPALTPASASGKTLTVLAAASLTESFGEIGRLFEAAHPGVKVAFSFAGSQQLAQQLNQGAPADVFASASPKYMSSAIDAKRVDQEDAKTFARNKLTVVYPAANPAGLKTLQDLAKPGVKLVLEDKSVPAGQYSLAFLDNAVKDKSFDPAYKDNVLKNVVSYEDNVKSVLTKVQLGEADAGIVYTTDAATDTAGKTEQIAIPDALNVTAVYPIAPISDSANPGLAKAFIDLVMSPEGQAVMAKYGFIPPG